MPASENKYETGFYINCLLSCFRNILIAILCLLVASLSFGWAIQKYGYFKYYKFIPGEYTGYRLHQLSILVPEKTCLILGSSTAREAFDIEKLEERFPTLNFVTLATTGPYNSSTIIDIQASIIPKNQYACIIVGTHPFSIFTPDNTSYQLRENNYFSQIPFFELLRMIRFDGNISIQELKFLISIVLMPNRRHSAILYAHLESATREMKTLIDEGRIFNIRSSHFTNQMKDKSTFHLRYKDERSKKMRLFIEKRRKQIALNDLENPKRYSSAATNGALTASIKKLDTLTNRLIVLDLPETPVYDRMIEVSNSSFKRALYEANSDFEFYQCEFTFTDQFDGFVDTIHVNSLGRLHLTKALGDILNASTENAMCRIPNLQ